MDCNFGVDEWRERTNTSSNASLQESYTIPSSKLIQTIGIAALQSSLGEGVPFRIYPTINFEFYASPIQLNKRGSLHTIDTFAAVSPDQSGNGSISRWV